MKHRRQHTESGSFTGTADYYAMYRLPYPVAVLRHLEETFALDGTGHLLDIGCGPGLLTFALHPYFESSLGIDRDPFMIEVAQRESSKRALVNIEFKIGSAEQVFASDKLYRLVTFGTSFHWMDRAVVAQQVRSMVAPKGGIAILTAFSLWQGSEPWKEILNEVVFSYTGHDRRSDNQIFPEASPHSEILIQSGFSNPTIVFFESVVTYSLETLLGFLYSTSFASKARLGDRCNAFEEDLAFQLRDFDSGGLFNETVKYEVVCASV